MKRQDFVTSSLAASAVAGLTADALGSQASGAATAGPAREYYQLLIWHLRRGPQQKLLDDFLRQAALPAMGRIGLGPIGVFNTMVGPESPRVYVLVPGMSLEVLTNLPAHLFADSEFTQAGATYLNAPAGEPAFVRMESFLLRAFEGIPKVDVPPSTAERRPRIFELRVYESHSKKANLTKIEMFNKGEIAIFRRTGLRPVFFGETLIGSGLPSLTYMLTFDNLEHREKAWAAFIADPEWQRLSATPGYTDVEIVSNISNAILSPAPYSQI